MDKLKKLRDIISKMNGAVVAFSGGVDSSLVLKVAHEVLGERVLGVIARSPTYSESEFAGAVDVAKLIGVKYISIDTKEFEDPRFINNPPDRCYYCKSELFNSLKKIAGDSGYEFVLEGSNLDDNNDYRPGKRAVRELGIRSPLSEAGFTKLEVRELARELGLPNWDKPALACLASRIPYGENLSMERLQRIENSEQFILSLGFAQVRVRDHGTVARIEVKKDDLVKIMEETVRSRVAGYLREMGYYHITVDLEGYETGSMNRELALKSPRNSQTA